MKNRKIQPTLKNKDNPKKSTPAGSNLELADKDFKVFVVTMFQDIRKNC